MPSNIQTSDEQNFWRAQRLQHLADRALRISNRHPSMSRASNHHFARYRKLLRATIDAWQDVDVCAHDRHPLSKVAA